MLTYSLNEDSNFGDVTGLTVMTSPDGGATWATDLPPYDVNGFHNGNGELRWVDETGAIVGIGSFVRPADHDGMRDFVTHLWRFEDGGRRYTVQPWAARIVGLPRDVDVVRADGAGNQLGALRAFETRLDVPSRWQFAALNPFGEVVRLADGTFGTPMSVRFAGDALESSVFMTSADDGVTWSYRSTIADQSAVPGAIEGFDECGLVTLSDGRLLCVSRVGDSQRLHRSYGDPLGLEWSTPSAMDAWSVAPTIRRLNSGTLALTTGRPGIYLWLCFDGVGDQWYPIELVEEHHNAIVDEAFLIQHPPSEVEYHEHLTFQTSAYVSFIEIEPDHLLIAYDRTPCGWLGSTRALGYPGESQIFIVDALLDHGASVSRTPTVRAGDLS